MAALYMGMCDAAGSTVVVMARNRHIAEMELYRKWRATVWPGFQPTVLTFKALQEWNGAAVHKMPVGKAFIWEQGEGQ